MCNRLAAARVNSQGAIANNINLAHPSFDSDIEVIVAIGFEDIEVALDVFWGCILAGTFLYQPLKQGIHHLSCFCQGTVVYDEA